MESHPKLGVATDCRLPRLPPPARLLARSRRRGGTSCPLTRSCWTASAPPTSLRPTRGCRQSSPPPAVAAPARPRLRRWRPRRAVAGCGPWPPTSTTPAWTTRSGGSAPEVSSCVSVQLCRERSSRREFGCTCVREARGWAYHCYVVTCCPNVAHVAMRPWVHSGQAVGPPTPARNATRFLLPHPRVSPLQVLPG